MTSEVFGHIQPEYTAAVGNVVSEQTLKISSRQHFLFLLQRLRDLCWHVTLIYTWKHLVKKLWCEEVLCKQRQVYRQHTDLCHKELGVNMWLDFYSVVMVTMKAQIIVQNSAWKLIPSTTRENSCRNVKMCSGWERSHKCLWSCWILQIWQEFTVCRVCLCTAAGLMRPNQTSASSRLNDEFTWSADILVISWHTSQIRRRRSYYFCSAVLCIKFLKNDDSCFCAFCRNIADLIVNHLQSNKTSQTSFFWSYRSPRQHCRYAGYCAFCFSLIVFVFLCPFIL